MKGIKTMKQLLKFGLVALVLANTPTAYADNQGFLSWAYDSTVGRAMAHMFPQKLDPPITHTVRVHEAMKTEAIIHYGVGDTLLGYAGGTFAAGESLATELLDIGPLDTIIAGAVGTVAAGGTIITSGWRSLKNLLSSGDNSRLWSLVKASSAVRLVHFSSDIVVVRAIQQFGFDPSNPLVMISSITTVMLALTDVALTYEAHLENKKQKRE